MRCTGKQHIINSRILGLLILPLTVAACSSPLDVDTPRDKYYDDPATPPVVSTVVEARMAGISFTSDNQQQTSFTCVWSGPVMFDTAEGKPALWMEGICTRPADALQGDRFTPIREFKIRLDSLSLIGSPVQIIDGNSHEAQMILDEIYPIEQTVFPNGGSTSLRLTSVVHDRKARTIDAVIMLSTLDVPRGFETDGRLHIEY